MMISYTAKPLHRYIELIGDRRPDITELTNQRWPSVFLML